MVLLNYYTQQTIFTKLLRNTENRHKLCYNLQSAFLETQRIYLEITTIYHNFLKIIYLKLIVFSQLITCLYYKKSV